MSTIFEDLDKIYPEEKHVTLYDKFSGKEMILPEKLCIEKFGETRWHKITSGMDKAFDAYPYGGK